MHLMLKKYMMWFRILQTCACFISNRQLGDMDLRARLSGKHQSACQFMLHPFKGVAAVRMGNEVIQTNEDKAVRMGNEVYKQMMI